MEVLDTSVAAVALPYMAGSLSASNDESTWVLTSYLVSSAIMLPAYRVAGDPLRSQAAPHHVRRDLHPGLFRPSDRRAMALAVYGLGVVAAPILGPTLGGWITDNYSWRWIFFINTRWAHSRPS
jgi:MFS transporter, DHA2 family, multidrug resistance protein